MKVVIADDEIHICSLIRHVIAWDRLGLTLLGVFSSGEDVLEQFAKEPADILICDIEMPGMSGTELIGQLAKKYPDCRCVVISGFRNFEYARTAMQYGVAHYLLKPIDGDELNKVLKSIVDSQDTPSTPQTISEQNIRLSLADILQGNESPGPLAVLNGQYHYRMQNGMFQIISAVFTDVDIRADFLPKVMSLFSDILKQKLLDFCYDAEVFRLLPVSALVLVNYERDKPKLTHSMLDAALRETLTELGGKTQCKCFFGVGVPVESVESIAKSVQSSQQAVCGRFVSQNRQIYYAEFMERIGEKATVAEISLQDRQAFTGFMESINTVDLEAWANALFQRKRREFEKAPQLAFFFCQAVVELMIGVFDQLQVPVNNKEAFRKQAQARFCACSTHEGLRKTLVALAHEEIAHRLEDKQQNMTVYAQQAMNYIEKHYADTITLEVIADKLHISPVHLSVVFKRETGMNYSKYLAAVRVEKAKALLKQPNMNLSQVANAVGYDSTSYFSNLFRKHTGLKPAEYRRLHQQNIGD